MKINIAGRTFALPANRMVRITIGIFLIIGGILGFLPILGFWMIPLGLVVLSADFVFIRKFRRRAEIAIGGWRKRRRKNNSHAPHEK